MLTRITAKELADELKKEHPSWDERAIAEDAADLAARLDARLEDALIGFLREGKRTDFREGEFSVLMIQAFRGNCPFLEAVELMDAYLKDPVQGKAQILRRVR